MKKIGMVICGILLMFGIVSSAGATLVYQAGLEDDFATSADPAAPSSLLVAAAGANQSHTQNTHLQNFQDFDLIAGVNGSNNCAVGHTFTDLPTNISSAYLEMTIMGGNDPFTYSDKIIFSFVELALDDFLDPVDYESYWVDTIAWQRWLSPGYDNYTGGLYDPGLVTSKPLSFGDVYNFTLNLDALPMIDGSTISLLDDLEFYGFFDVIIEDETGVDFMRLTIETIPEPTTIFLLGSGLIGLAGVKRKFFAKRARSNTSSLAAI